MAKKNQDQDRKIFESLSAAILSYGEEGRDDLEDIFDEHRPDAIFKLAPGPDRSVRAARLLADMREARADLEGRLGPGESPGPGSAAVRISKIGIEYPGVYEGFRYVIAQLPNKKWAAKITKRGRQILEDPGLPDAPVIVGSPDLNRLFNSQAEAENAVHRVIRRALIWYGERGLTPREKYRKTEAGRAGIQRRTAGQVAERERQAAEAAAEKREESRRSKIREARREEKMHRLDRPPRTTAQSPGRGRRLLYIPKKNPSNPFTFSHSEPDALNQGKRAVQKYKEWEERWNDSLRSNNPDFKAAFKAYDHIVNAAANFILAKEPALAGKAEKIQFELRRGLIEILVFCNRGLGKKSARKKSEDIARLHMDRADRLWDQYVEVKKFRDLLAAYKHLEIAREEFIHDGDEEGAEKAATRVRLAKKEINTWMKK